MAKTTDVMDVMRKIPYIYKSNNKTQLLNNIFQLLIFTSFSSQIKLSMEATISWS